MNSKKPQVPKKPNSKFFIRSASTSSFSQNVHSILTHNPLMPNKPQRPNNSAQMDTVSESGFKMPNFNLSSKLNNIGSFYRNRKKPRSQSININPCANVVDADSPSIDGAMFFLSSSNGLCGNLSFGKKSILFEFGRDLGESHSANSSIPLDPTEPKCPIKEEPVRNSYAIDFLNIGDIYAEQSTDHLSITIFCQNFKHVKISLKQSEIASAIIDKIKTDRKSVV